MTCLEKYIRSGSKASIRGSSVKKDSLKVWFAIKMLSSYVLRNGKNKTIRFAHGFGRTTKLLSNISFRD